jgi:small conductance mechanosensitive channel
MHTFLAADETTGESLRALWEKLNGWITEPGIGQTLVIAAIIFFFGGMIIRLVKGIVYRAAVKTSKDETLARFIAAVVNQMLRLVLLIVILGTMGIDTTSLAAMLGGAGVALGFALRDTLGNLAAGILLIINRPFNEGDLIEAAGAVGVVEEIEISSTKIITGDNKVVIIPNGALASGIVTNYTKKDTRRVDLVAGIGYGDDTDKAQKILEDILSSHALVLADPAPKVALIALADSSVNFNVRPWCKTGDYWTVYSEVTEQIKKRFDAEGINIPYPQQDLHIHQVA